MDLYKPSELHQFLSEMGIKPKKRLSQNFLIDGNILKKMIEATDLQEEDTVVEIGPGPGVLTKALLDKGASVIAIEKDPKLANYLKRLQNGKLQILVDDFRNIRFKNLLKGEHKIKVIANIPYSLTGIILQELLPKQDLITSIHLMVQKEVAARCTADVKAKDYSSFTLFTDHHADAKLLFTVPKTCFYPKPKVDSAVLELKLKTPPVDAPYEKLFEMIRMAFQMRRKMLRASLKKIAPPVIIEAALETLGLPKNARPQELTLADFSALFHILNSEKTEET
ncbi:MAG: 16S rRNA (adenine(1518)-N(6)/adenine(1519)-N(6))-dimethyltransferase RsmA [Candidatus Neptunochlamydia sp.]|nr:16S rRNA (adenine(1518)-N(6)/adenine(1519)-N(6))-dimethyltransferase RsmA [Candidatus Neptunochlamydia sp.]